jgi:hypothetical protein
VSNDIFRDQVTLRNPEGEFRTIPLAQLRKETAPGVVPAEAEVPNGELVAIKRVSADDEEADIEADTPDDVGGAVGAVEELEASEPDAAEDLRDDEPTGDTSTTGSNASGSTGTQSSASGDSSAADDPERRRRRRRGRRGGRRNRGPDAPPSSDS